MNHRAFYAAARPLTRPLATLSPLDAGRGATKGLMSKCCWSVFLANARS